MDYALLHKGGEQKRRLRGPANSPLRGRSGAHQVEPMRLTNLNKNLIYFNQLLPSLQLLLCSFLVNWNIRRLAVIYSHVFGQTIWHLSCGASPTDHTLSSVPSCFLVPDSSPSASSPLTTLQIFRFHRFVFIIFSNNLFVIFTSQKVTLREVRYINNNNNKL